MRDVLVVVVPRKCFLLHIFCLLLVFFFYCKQTQTHIHMNYQSLAAFYVFAAFIYSPYTRYILCLASHTRGSRHGLISKSNQKIIPQIFISFVLRNNVIVFAFLTTPAQPPYTTQRNVHAASQQYFLLCLVAHVLKRNIIRAPCNYKSFSFFLIFCHAVCVCVNEQFSVLI